MAGVQFLWYNKNIERCIFVDENKILRFAQLIKDSSNVVFFGGAGVSTESGMKDYRSEDGLYNTVKQYNVSPETI